MTISTERNLHTNQLAWMDLAFSKVGYIYILGFLCRTYVMIQLFIISIRLIENEHKLTFHPSIFRFIGGVIFLISAYLFHNLITSKLKKEAYEKWCGALVILIILSIVTWQNVFLFGIAD